MFYTTSQLSIPPFIRQIIIDIEGILVYMSNITNGFYLVFVRIFTSVTVAKMMLKGILGFSVRSIANMDFNPV
jgi:hypothetical protein